MKSFFIFFFIIFLTFSGCKNDLLINAPFKDIPVIYGFLDQNEPIQYIRIEKLYQNSITTNTSQGARIADSLYFDTLVVKLINIVNKDTFNCYRVDTIPKDNGFFSSGRNTLYATTIPKNDNANEVYQLYIINPRNNNVFTSQTSLVKDAVIDYRKVTINPKYPNNKFFLNFSPGRNSALYDLVLRYQYKEMNITDTNVFQIKNIDYYVAKSAILSADLKYIGVTGRDYLSFLSSHIAVDNTKTRRTLGIIYQVYGGSAEFVNYLELSTPNLSIVQKNGPKGNITNGLGIFSSRNFTELQMGTDAATIAVIESQLPNFHP